MFCVLRDETRKARKEHRCIWCGEVIVVGNSYRYQSGVFDGEIQGNHWHAECFRAAAEECDWEFEFIPYENDRPPKQEDGALHTDAKT